MYRIGNSKNTINIHNPAYIMIDKDKGFEISQREAIWEIRNSKLIVCLWKNVENMHITIF